MIWLLVALAAVLWLGRRRRSAAPQLVVIVIQPGDDGDDQLEPGPVTDRDVHDWING